MGRMAYLRPVLDRYVRHGLRRSELKEDHKKGEKLTSRLRLLGMQITETESVLAHHQLAELWLMSVTKLRRFLRLFLLRCNPWARHPCSDCHRLREDFGYNFAEGVMDDEAGGAIAKISSTRSMRFRRHPRPYSYDREYCVG